MIFAIYFSSAYANVDVNFKITEQGYWYGKAVNNTITTLDLPFDVCWEFLTVTGSLSSPELLCFLTGILNENTVAYKKLTVWDYFKKLPIPQHDYVFLNEKKKSLVSLINNNKKLFEKIRAFWGASKSCQVFCFLSMVNSKSYNGAWFCNFIDRKENISAISLVLPTNNRPLAEYISIVGHEFSHAMCDAVYGREIFEKITKNVKSRNSIVAGWYLNEILAILLGNCLIQEHITGINVNPSDEDYCAKGVASALYELTKNYFENSKKIDKVFISEAVRQFDLLYPHGYKDPNICLYKLHIVCPKNIREADVMLHLFKKTTISSSKYTSFSSLTNNAIEVIQREDDTVLVVFSMIEQLSPLKKILPEFDAKIPVNVVCKNKKTYVFLKIDENHSLEKCIDLLFCNTGER